MVRFCKNNGWIIASLLMLGLLRDVSGQEQSAPKTTAPKATKNAVGTASGDAAEFRELFARRGELGMQLEKLQKEMDAAIKARDQKKYQELATKFNGLITNFEKNELPRLVTLGQGIYLKDPKNKEAEIIVLGHLQELFHQNRYQEVIEEGSKYLAAGRKHPLTLNFLGVCSFAIQDFAQAVEFLELAKQASKESEEGGQIFAQLGSRYLDDAPGYAKMWKTEQAIRAREAAAKGDARLPRVAFETTAGTIEIELFENEAPNTVANFINLIEKKKYDGVAFHRVIPNFMAQGGDPNTLDKDPRNDGMGGPGYHIACECYQPNARMHFQGSLSMAHAGKDTGGSQFFITHLPTGHLNPNADEGRGHTVFGRVVKGLNVALSLRPGDTITSAKVLFKRNHPYVPKTLKDPEAEEPESK